MGFLTNKLMLAELSFALSKHCLCHYNGAWLAFVSITLSKHRFCNDKPSCTSVDHSQQALLLDAHPLLACSCLRLLASIGFGHPKTSCLGVSQSEQALLLYIQKQLARLSVTLCKHRIWLSTLSLAVDYSWQASCLDAHPLCCEGSIPKPHSFLTTVSHRKESNNDTRNFIKAT